MGGRTTTPVSSYITRPISCHCRKRLSGFERSRRCLPCSVAGLIPKWIPELRVVQRRAVFSGARGKEND
jgi:hypothetical protein